MPNFARVIPVLILILVCSSTVLCQLNNVWNGITPLKSTRQDVEKILGKHEPSSVARYAGGYRTEDGRIFVLYSTGLCDVNPDNGWNIPELTVISLSYYPTESPKLSDLKIDLKKFERHQDPEITNLISYANQTDGVVLNVDSSDNSIVSFNYFPESKYDHLMCKNRTSK
jgi:hypothetical protein